jgi:hypothetical protein
MLSYIRLLGFLWLCLFAVPGASVLRKKKLVGLYPATKSA